MQCRYEQFWHRTFTIISWRITCVFVARVWLTHTYSIPLLICPVFYINIFPLSCEQSYLMHETTPFTCDSQDKSKVMTRNKLYASMRTKSRTSSYCACAFLSLVQTAFSAVSFLFPQHISIFLSRFVCCLTFYRKFPTSHFWSSSHPSACRKEQKSWRTPIYSCHYSQNDI